jgi:ESX secretion-associated protein EspA/E
MRDQCGDGEPDPGNDFLTGAAAFERIGDTLAGTDPPDSWQGAASEAYGLANEHQRHRASSMANTDTMIQSVLAAEAQKVADTRQTIDNCIQALNAAFRSPSRSAPPGWGTPRRTDSKLSRSQRSCPWPWCASNG